MPPKKRFGREWGRVRRNNRADVGWHCMRISGAAESKRHIARGSRREEQTGAANSTCWKVKQQVVRTPIWRMFSLIR